MKTFYVTMVLLAAAGAVTMASAATDIGPYYWVLKKRNFTQTSSAAPAQTSSAPFQLDSFVSGASDTTLTSGTLTPPGSGVVNVPLAYTLTSEGGLLYDSFVSSQVNLDNSYGSGGFRLDVKGADHEDAVTLFLTGNIYPVEIPAVSNTGFNVGQLIVDAAASFTLNWNSFAGAGQLDLILLTINEGSANVLREVLPATAVSRSFAAHFFTAEKMYSAELSFIKTSDRNAASISGSTGFSGYATSTKIALSTSSRTPVSGFGNISTRGLVGTLNDVLISGFIVTNADTTSKLRVVVRGMGPSLSTSGITGPLADPTLALFDGQGHVISTNDEWSSDPNAQEIQALGLAPANSHESALLADLAPGNYTVIISGKGNTTGVGLAEVYNLSSAGDATLANISTRGQVKTNEQAMIGGLIVQGIASHDVILRAIGPSLSNSGVPNVLQNPVLQLFNSQGTLIAENDDWRDAQKAQIQATGLAPANDLESAIMTTLSPGSYTAVVTGKNKTTGVGLVEAYQLN